MQLKYQRFKDQLKPLALSSLYYQHCFVAVDYPLQLEYFLKGKDILQPGRKRWSA